MRGFKIGVWVMLLAFSSIGSVPAPAEAQTATAQQYYAAGVRLYQAKNYAQAARYYYAALKADPRHAQAYQGMGNCYYALGRKKEALAYYQRASALQPNNTQLAQFVRQLSAQVGGGTAATAAAPSGNAFAQGARFFQQKQYAASIPYFQQAIRQTPNDYRPYYYAGYAYYMTGNARNAAVYFAIANAKQPNPSVKAYADRVKGSLPAAEQQWVDAQVARYTGGAVPSAVAKKEAKASDVTFGFHILGGVHYVLADPTAMIEKMEGFNASYEDDMAVSMSGVTPNIVALPQLQPFVRIGENLEINLTIGYLPIGLLSYRTHHYNPDFVPGGSDPYVPYASGNGEFEDIWQYNYRTSVVTVDLGGKFFFGGKDVRGYLGLSGGISPISMSFEKINYQTDETIVNGAADPANGEYSTVAVSAQALLGVDFNIAEGLSFGPYLGFRYLAASDFKGEGGPLMINTQTGAVGLEGGASQNLPVGAPLEPLKLDFTGITGGLNLTFSF